MFRNLNLFKLPHLNQHLKHIFTVLFKRILHPKMKIVSFSYSHVVTNLYKCICSDEHKIFWGMFVTKQITSPIRFYSILFSYYKSEWGSWTVWLQTFLKASFFMFLRTKTFIQVCNKIRVTKCDNFNFWMNYPSILNNHL